MCKRKMNINMKAMSKKYAIEKEGWTMKDIQENKFWKDIDRCTDSLARRLMQSGKVQERKRNRETFWVCNK